MTVAVVVDSSSGISPALAAAWGVHVVPLYIEWDGVTYRDQVDLMPGDFYQRLPAADRQPTTSAPTPADFLGVSRHLLDGEYDEVLILTVSSSLSISYESAGLVARELGGERVTVVDTRTGAGAHALLAAEAAELAASGQTAAEIAATVNRLLDRTEVLIIMSTLSYLRKSGRISTTKAAAGAALNMNPVVGFRDGSLDVMARPAGGRRARRFVEARLAALGPPTRALAMYTSSVDDAMAWRGFVQDRLGAPRFDVCPLSPVVGSTCGPGAHGLAVLWGADGRDGADR